MKSFKIISIALFFFTKTLYGQTLNNNQIIYTFKTISPKCLNVNAKFLGSTSGETHIIVPWESYSHLGKNDININVEGGMKAINTDIRNIKLAHQPNAKFTVSYDLCHDESSSNPHHPVIDNNFFHFDSNDVLLFPNIDLDKNREVIFDFSSMPEKDNVYSSFGIGKIINVNKKINEILFSQFVGGDIKPSIINIKDKPIYLIEYGKWSYFKDKNAYSTINDLILYQRNQMQDYSFPFYIITLIKQSDKVSFKTASGAYSKNSLSLTFPDGSKEKFHKILYTMSHELFHNWLGGKLEIPFHLRNQYRWFFEGFTDYYALKFAREGGFITDQQYIEILNFYIEDYYSSVLRTLPNTSYRKLAHPSGLEFNFIQTRGHLLALLFAELLQKKKMPEDTIKKFINDLILNASAKDNQLSDEIFWKCFDAHFDNDFKALVKKHIFNGELIPPPSIKGFRFTKKKINIIDPGFDLIKTIDNGKILKIKKSSPAFKAGLVDNANFRNYRPANNDKTKPQISVTYQINQDIKEVVFEPKLVKVKTYQYYKVEDKTLNKS